MQPLEFIGVDIGEKRIGVARGSSLAKLAEPLDTIPADGAVEKLKGIANDRRAAGIVVGLPRSLEGRETSQTDFVREWVGVAKAAIELPFFWQDEALTTVEAQKSGAKKDAIDAYAAAAILQDFLNLEEKDRVYA